MRHPLSHARFVMQIKVPPRVNGKTIKMRTTQGESSCLKIWKSLMQIVGGTVRGRRCGVMFKFEYFGKLAFSTCINVLAPIIYKASKTIDEIKIQRLKISLYCPFKGDYQSLLELVVWLMFDFSGTGGMSWSRFTYYGYPFSVLENTCTLFTLYVLWLCAQYGKK